jgi:hypothetical protein
MNFRKIKKITFALTLALGFTGAPGLSTLSTVQAQEPRRQEMRREQLEKRVLMEERSAFREGWRRGFADSRRGWRPDPSRHQAYRMGNRLQRRDFRMGYARGFRRERIR